jgi:deoxyribonuclease-4
VLIGAHVSTAGGLDKAVSRGADLGCEAIQIFNQSPRMWKATDYGEEDFARFREALDDSPIDSVIIHAVYLINCATPDRELARKSRASLTHALRIGDAIGADGVVLHPGARKDGKLEPAIKRSGKVISQALSDSDACPVLIEQMAGHKGILGTTLEEVEAITEAAGGGERVGLCLDSCHLFAAGYDVRTPESLSEVVDEVDRRLGLERLRALHVNDSREGLGSKRDRHADLGDGEIGDRGMACFLSEPRFEGLPATLETPGPEKKGPTAAEVADAFALRKRGLASRKRSIARRKRARKG